MAAGRYENDSMSWQQLHATLLDMHDESRQMLRGFVEGQVYQAQLVVALNDLEGLLEEENLGLIYVHLCRCFFSGKRRPARMLDLVGKPLNVVVQKSKFDTESFKLNDNLGFHTLISFKAKVAYFDQQRPTAKLFHYELGKWTKGKGRLPQYFVELVEESEEEVHVPDIQDQSTQAWPSVPAPSAPAQIVPAPSVPAPSAPARIVQAPSVPAPSIPALSIPAPRVQAPNVLSFYFRAPNAQAPDAQILAEEPRVEIVHDERKHQPRFVKESKKAEVKQRKKMYQRQKAINKALSGKRFLSFGKKTFKWRIFNEKQKEKQTKIQADRKEKNLDNWSFVQDLSPRSIPNRNEKTLGARKLTKWEKERNRQAKIQRRKAKHRSSSHQSLQTVTIVPKLINTAKVENPSQLEQVPNVTSEEITTIGCSGKTEREEGQADLRDKEEEEEKRGAIQIVSDLKTEDFEGLQPVYDSNHNDTSSDDDGILSLSDANNNCYQEPVIKEPEDLEMMRLLEKAEEKEKQVSQIARKKQLLEKAVAEVKKRTEARIEQIDRKTKTKDEIDQQISGLVKEKAAAEEKSAILTKAKDSWDNGLARLVSEKEKWEQRVAQMTKEKLDWEKRLPQLQPVNGEARSESIEKNRAEWDIELGHLVAEREKWPVRIGRLNKARDEIESQVDAACKDLQELNERITRLTEENDGLEKDICQRTLGKEESEEGIARLIAKAEDWGKQMAQVTKEKEELEVRIRAKQCLHEV